MAVAPPFEMLELLPGESRTFAVLSAEEGRATIMPRDGRPPKEIPVLRLHVDPKDKPLFPHYYDVTSLTLQAQLRPLILTPGYTPARFTIGKVGAGPQARFTVIVRPA